MHKRKHSWAAIVGGGNKKGEKMAGENARMLPKATHEERKKQEAKKKEKLKTLAGKLLKTAVGGKETVEKAGAEDVAGNLLKRPSSRKGEERGMPAGNLEIISGSRPESSLPLPSIRLLVFISFWIRCFALSGSPSLHLNSCPF